MIDPTKETTATAGDVVLCKAIPELTLDQAILEATKPFGNGCSFRVRFLSSGSVSLDYGCYRGPYAIAGWEQEALHEFLGGKPRQVRIHPTTKVALMRPERQCKWCHYPLFEPRSPAHPMSEENDTSSATDQSVKDTGITAGEVSWNTPTKQSLAYARDHGYTDPDIIEGLAKIQDDNGAYTVAATLRLLSMKLSGGDHEHQRERVVQKRNHIDSDRCSICHAAMAPAEVSDKRQDYRVADEIQLSREQIDDMNSGD